MAAPKQDLTLDRGLQNDKFQSWRLSPTNCLAARHALALPGPVVAVKSEAIDYLHTRASVLRNHLLEVHGGRLFCFLAGGPADLPAQSQPLHVMEVCCTLSGSGAAEASLRSLAGTRFSPTCNSLPCALQAMSL